MNDRILPADAHWYNCYVDTSHGVNRKVSYETFDEFYTEWHNAEIYANLIFRWDVREYEEEEENYIPGEENLYAEVFVMHQRLGSVKHIVIDKFDREDEPKMIEILIKHWIYLKEIWKPISNGIRCPNCGSDGIWIGNNDFECNYCGKIFK